MNANCQDFHLFAAKLRRFSFPFDKKDIPSDGIYILFESGEAAHNTERIVRIGTHNGLGRLGHRLIEHFEKENKDRSIFRKNIGRAILNAQKDPFLDFWELDLTKRSQRELYKGTINFEKQFNVEQWVTKHINTKITFAVIPVQDKDNRLRLECGLISMIYNCSQCKPSANWLGLNSPIRKIREGGLWNAQGLKCRQLDNDEYDLIVQLTG